MKGKNMPVLRLLEGGYGTINPDPRCEIAAQAVMAGLRTTASTAGTPKPPAVGTASSRSGSEGS